MAPQKKPYSGLDLFGDLARQSVSNFTTGASTFGANLVGAPVAAASWLFPGLSDLGGQRDSLGYAVRSTPAASATALRSRVGTIPGGTTYQEGPTAEIVSRSKGDINYADYPVGVPFSTSKGLFKRNANGSFDRVAPQQFDRATYSSGGGGGGAPARRTAPATSPNTITQAADDTYKQLLSQYGGQAGVSQLAGQTSLPTGFTPEGGKQAASLKDYYAAQQAVGAKNIGDIISSMGYTGPMAEWAKANPMLAQREFAKQRARGVRTSEDVTDQAMQEAAAKGQYFAPPGEPTPDPVTQQRMQQYSTAFQAQKGTEDSSAAQRSQDFINKYKLGSLNIGSYNFPSYDASAMMNAPSQLFK
ncbi:hypothetical protein EBT25_00480 [bacterium]|nr:hypothetical protein [bacterium]